MNNVELLLTNGKKILMSNFDLSKVYDVREITKSKLFFSNKFPFIKIIDEPITKFRYRTQYSSMNDFFDDRYSVACNLMQFCHIVGIDVDHWEKSIMDSDLRGCG